MKKIVSLIIVMMIVSLINFETEHNDQIILTMLDVGQGDSILIRLPNSQKMLIDGGPDNSLAYVLSEALPWWERKIDYLVMTHADKDHYAGFNSLLDRYEIGEFWYSGDQNSAPEFKYFIDTLYKRRVPIKIKRAGEKYIWPDGIEMTVLWPLAGQEVEGNPSSLVVRLVWGQSEVLLTGDLEIKQEQQLLGQSLELSSDILKVSHHGSNGGSSGQFLAVVKPKTCLISAGLDNQFGHPNPLTLDRLTDSGCQILSTLGKGSISLIISSSSYSVLPP